MFFDGVAAPMLYAGPNQVNAIVPYGIKSPTTQLTVQRGGITDGPRPLPVEAAVPGIFTANSAGFGQGAVVNQDGTYNSAANPALKGSVIVFYAVGAGAMSPPMADGAVAGRSAAAARSAGERKRDDSRHECGSAVRRGRAGLCVRPAADQCECARRRGIR